MYARLPKYVALFLLSAFLASGCGNTNEGASPTTPTEVRGSMGISAEPEVVTPEFLPSPFCARFRPFGARILIVVRPGRDLVLRGVRFHFIDRFGVRAVPTAIPLVTTTSGPSGTPGSTIPVPGSATIPIPGSSTIPIPGSPSSFDPLMILGGSQQTLPFFLQFDCGVPADGTVFVNVDTTNGSGSPQTSQLRVEIRS
jgi:hypothetical protein